MSSHVPGKDRKQPCKSTSRHDQQPPTEKLCKWASTADWASLLERMKTHPQDARFVNELHGNTALHEACYNRPPPSVVTVLLQANPYAAATPNRYEKAALHIACWHHASYEVLRMLLVAAPRSACLEDVRGRTPIKSLWAGNFGNKVDIRLMNALAEVRSPADFKLSGAAESIYSSDSDVDQYSDDDDTDSAPSCKSHYLLGEFWQCAVLLLDTSHREGKKVATHHPADHPLLVLRAAAALGICAATNAPLVNLGCGNSKDKSNSKAGLVRVVSRLLPVVIERTHNSITSSLGERRFLLNVAIEDGLTWESTILENLIKVRPAVLSLRDVKTKLFPFMLAAVACSGGDNLAACEEGNRRREGKHDILNTIYNLMRADPSLIRKRER